ncbi:hypothetical protein [Sebaldella sp. S0638]|uniref:hypothetical protein n=1 Tax=Sebaldella sp. S0638 TaxID=2957809 RepID=UPI0020A1A367|nr:hypothetical protein [Sebaldella sp. S0638]MCP1225899.1 hypothetical protein [Sebaldella sp. S0638]
MIKIMFFLFLISNMIMGVNNLNQTGENREKIDKQIIKFYEKNRILKCNFDINEKLRKVELIYDGIFYSGIVDAKNKPQGTWKIKSGTYECYENDKYLFISTYQKIYENKVDKYNIMFLPKENIYYLGVRLIIDGNLYDRNYILLENEVIKIKKNPYTFNEDKFILRILKENKYQEISY